ncbi:BREX system ATP-binding domain-containing protein [Micromonospora zhanjiangensis]
MRLPGFSQAALVELGLRVREIYGSPRVDTVVDDAYLNELARAVAGRLGGRVGVAPRLYLKKLVADILDRVDQFDDWDPRRHYEPTLRTDELTDVERNAATAGPRSSADDVDLPM